MNKHLGAADLIGNAVNQCEVFIDYTDSGISDHFKCLRAIRYEGTFVLLVFSDEVLTIPAHRISSMSSRVQCDEE